MEAPFHPFARSPFPRTMVENELQFVGWKEFQQMVPSIVQLEISRLGRVIETVREDTERCNALVKARFELKQYVACLQEADKATLEDTCAPHLEVALLTISVQTNVSDDPTTETLRYIADRLHHVHDRMELIY